MQAYELLAKLNILTLTGQNEDRELEWLGTSKDWNNLEIEEESILREYHNDF